MTITARFVAAFALLLSAGAAQAATVMTLTDLKLRSGPGTGYGTVTVLPRGAQLHLGDCSDDLHWCKVYWRGREGWASSHYLSEPGEARPQVVQRRPVYRRRAAPTRQPAYQEYPNPGDVLLGPVDRPIVRPGIFLHYGVGTHRWRYD